MSEQTKIPYSFKKTDSSFWVIDIDGNKILRDPKQENEDLGGFDWHKYSERGCVFDDLNYMYWENNDFYVHESNGSDYERFGCVIEPGDVVVDIGANIGIFARRALNRGASRVFAFEPSSKIFSCLLDNTPRSTVECHRIAVGGFNGTTRLNFDITAGIGGSSIVQEMNQEKAGSENVICLTLNQLFEIGILPEKIDFMKVDCEGAEKQIMDDLTDENLSKIKKIAMEFHTVLLGEEARKSMVERLANFGFSHFTLFHGSGAEVTLNFWRN